MNGREHPDGCECVPCQRIDARLVTELAEWRASLARGRPVKATRKDKGWREPAPAYADSTETATGHTGRHCEHVKGTE